MYSVLTGKEGGKKEKAELTGKGPGLEIEGPPGALCFEGHTLGLSEMGFPGWKRKGLDYGGCQQVGLAGRTCGVLPASW